MTFSSLGIGSGLDLNSLVSQLVAVEGRPKEISLSQSEINITTKLTALGSVKGAISDFKSAVDGMQTLSSFQGRNVFSSDTSVFTVSGSAAAAVGSHSMRVEALASAHTVASASAFSSKSDVVGTGTLTFQFGTDSSPFVLNSARPSKSVTISSSNNSVQGIRDAVNAADIGVTAAIVNDGTGERLVFTSDFSGLENSLKITVSGDSAGTDTDTTGLSQLAYDPDAAIGNGKNLTQTVAATNASIIMDGIAVSKSSNTITDVIEGVTITLKKADPGVDKSIDIELDTAGTRAKVEGFVDSFNSMIEVFNSVTAYNPETQQAAALTGDFTVRSSEGRIRSLMGTVLNDVSGSLRSLSDLGIRTERDGTLSIEDDILTKALTEHYEDIGRVFAVDGVPTDSLITYEGSDSSTLDGSYDVNITTLATQGFTQGSAAVGSLTITDGVNDEIKFDIEGTTGTIDLTAQTYTSTAELAAEVQSKINGLEAFSSKGITVTVTESAGVITVTSDKYGDESTVSAYGGNGVTNLLGVAPRTETAGIDVAGTIGGQAATGDGQVLTGTNAAAGLAITVTGGSIGDRGSIAFSRGISENLSTYLDELVNSAGSITSRINNFNEQLDDIDDERVELQRYLASVEERLTQQYAALDSLVADLQSQSAFLTNALASLPGAGSSASGSSSS